MSKDKKANKKNNSNVQPGIDNDKLGENTYEEFSDMLEYERAKNNQDKNKSRNK